MAIKKKSVRSKNTTTMMELNTKGVTGRRAKLKEYRRKYCRADNEFQDGEYTDEAYDPDDFTPNEEPE